MMKTYTTLFYEYETSFLLDFTLYASLLEQLNGHVLPGSVMLEGANSSQPCFYSLSNKDVRITFDTGKEDLSVPWLQAHPAQIHMRYCVMVVKTASNIPRWLQEIFARLDIPPIGFEKRAA